MWVLRGIKQETFDLPNEHVNTSHFFSFSLIFPVGFVDRTLKVKLNDFYGRAIDII